MSNRVLIPEDIALLREAASVLDDNGYGGDETAAKLSERIYALLNEEAHTAFDWKKFLLERRNAWEGFLEVDEDDDLANQEVDSIDHAIDVLSPGWLEAIKPVPR